MSLLETLLTLPLRVHFLRDSKGYCSRCSKGYLLEGFKRVFFLEVLKGLLLLHLLLVSYVQVGEGSAS